MQESLPWFGSSLIQRGLHSMLPSTALNNRSGYSLHPVRPDLRLTCSCGTYFAISRGENSRCEQDVHVKGLKTVLQIFRSCTDSMQLASEAREYIFLLMKMIERPFRVQRRVSSRGTGRRFNNDLYFLNGWQFLFFSSHRWSHVLLCLCLHKLGLLYSSKFLLSIHRIPSGYRYLSTLYLSSATVGKLL